MAKKQRSNDEREWRVFYRHDLFGPALLFTDDHGASTFWFEVAAVNACQVVIEGATEALVVSEAGLVLLRVIE